MANETAYTSISGMVASIYELALLTAQEGNVVAPFVHQFNDSNSAVPRVWGTYSGGTFSSVAETADLSQTAAFAASAAGTATPTVYAHQALITNRRIKSDPSGAISDTGLYLGQTAAAQIDTNLAGLFSSLAGGTVGSAGGTLTFANIMRAQAYLRTNKIFGRYTCVLHPVQWYYLTSPTTGVPTLLQAPALAESLVKDFYSASYQNIDFFVDANISSGTAAVASMFSRDAIYLDTRQGFQIEPQYNASYSGNGAWELNASMFYAYGVYRPTYGVQMLGTSA
jgi:hypothetical protein